MADAALLIFGEGVGVHSGVLEGEGGNITSTAHNRIMNALECDCCGLTLLKCKQ